MDTSQAGIFVVQKRADTQTMFTAFWPINDVPSTSGCHTLYVGDAPVGFALAN